MSAKHSITIECFAIFVDIKDSAALYNHVYFQLSANGTNYIFIDKIQEITDFQSWIKYPVAATTKESNKYIWVISYWLKIRPKFEEELKEKNGPLG